MKNFMILCITYFTLQRMRLKKIIISTFKFLWDFTLQQNVLHSHDLILNHENNSALVEILRLNFTFIQFHWKKGRIQIMIFSSIVLLNQHFLFLFLSLKTIFSAWENIILSIFYALVLRNPSIRRLHENENKYFLFYIKNSRKKNKN